MFKETLYNSLEKQWLLTVPLYLIPHLTKSRAFNSGCDMNGFTVGHSETLFYSRTRLSVLGVLTMSQSVQVVSVRLT